MMTVMRAPWRPVLLFMVLTSGARAECEPLTLPEYGPEEVICFALYTVHDNTLKLEI